MLILLMLKVAIRTGSSARPLDLEGSGGGGEKHGLRLLAGNPRAPVSRLRTTTCRESWARRQAQARR